MDAGDTSTTRPRERFERLAEEVYEPVQRYVRRRADADVVDDIVSDTMLDALASARRRPAQRPPPMGVRRRPPHVANHRRAAGRHLSSCDGPRPNPSRHPPRGTRSMRSCTRARLAPRRGSRAPPPVGVGTAGAFRDRSGARAHSERRFDPPASGQEETRRESRDRHERTRRPPDTHTVNRERRNGHERRPAAHRLAAVQPDPPSEPVDPITSDRARALMEDIMSTATTQPRRVDRRTPSDRRSGGGPRRRDRRARPPRRFGSRRPHPLVLTAERQRRDGDVPPVRRRDPARE
jgi:hypothetical protein